MDNIFFDMGVSFVLNAIRAAFKNEEKRAALKRALLKIRDQINLLYPDDLPPILP